MALTKTTRTVRVLLVRVDLQEGCITPVGEARLLTFLKEGQDAQPGEDDRRKIRVASGGTICTDVSQMGVLVLKHLAFWPVQDKALVLDFWVQALAPLPFGLPRDGTAKRAELSLDRTSAAGRHLARVYRPLSTLGLDDLLTPVRLVYNGEGQ